MDGNTTARLAWNRRAASARYQDANPGAIHDEMVPQTIGPVQDVRKARHLPKRSRYDLFEAMEGAALRSRPLVSYVADCTRGSGERSPRYSSRTPVRRCEERRGSGSR